MVDNRLFTQQMIDQLMKVQLTDGDEHGSKETITIERKTFNFVLLYILKHEAHTTEEQNQPFDKAMLNKLDGVLKMCEKEFEDVLDLIAKKTI